MTFQYMPCRNRFAISIIFPLCLLNLLLTAWWWSFSTWQSPTIRNVTTCKPDWKFPVFSNKTNTYEVSLVVQVADNGHGNGRSANRWVYGHQIQQGHSFQRIYTFADLAKIPDDRWKRPIPRSVFLLYPQALDMKQVVVDIMNCRPVPEQRERVRPKACPFNIPECSSLGPTNYAMTIGDAEGKLTVIPPTVDDLLSPTSGLFL